MHAQTHMHVILMIKFYKPGLDPGLAEPGTGLSRPEVIGSMSSKPALRWKRLALFTIRGEA